MQSTEKQVECLKGAVSDELYAALAKELAGKEGIKLANLASGAYVGREKYDALKGEYDALAASQKELVVQLRQAQSRTEALEGAEKEAQEWKQKAEQTAMDAEEQLAAARFDLALETKLQSAGAKNTRAARALLDVEALRRAKDAEAAIDEALYTVQQENPFLFGSNMPAIVAPAAGGAKRRTDGALRRAMGLE